MPDVTRLEPKDFNSDLDQIAREGARRMLAEALEAEVADYIARHQERDEHGRAQVVRNGKARPRKVTLGSGTIEVSAPRVEDRRGAEDGRRRRFRSEILPPYMRRSPKVAEVLPILYLRGLSTGDFKEGLAALLGSDASGLSPTAITRLTAAWQADYETFQKRDLSDRDYVYVWADGVPPARTRTDHRNPVCPRPRRPSGSGRAHRLATPTANAGLTEPRTGTSRFSGRRWARARRRLPIHTSAAQTPRAHRKEPSRSAPALEAGPHAT